MNFELHPRLAAGGVLVADLGLCRVLLKDDSRWPWLILVPRRAGLSELHQLTKADAAALMDEATALARRLASGPTLSYAAIKQAINAAATNTLDQQLDLERDSQRRLGKSADNKEGVAAFLAKRPAQFTGR